MAPTLSNPPNSTPLLQGPVPSPVWARWLQQLRDAAAQNIGLPYAAFSTASGQSIPNAAATVVNFDTKELDTENAVTTGAAWNFKVPTGGAGIYGISVATTFTSSLAAGNAAILMLYKNGSECRRLFREPISTAGEIGLSGSCCLSLADGDTIDARLFQNTGSPLALEALATANWITITALSLTG